MIQALLLNAILAAQVTAYPPTSVPVKRTDSLLRMLKKSKPDTNRVLTLYELAMNYNMSFRNDKTRESAREALQLSQKLNYKTGECLAYFIMANTMFSEKDLPGVFDTGKKILQLSQQIRFRRGKGLAYNLFGNYFFRKKNHTEALSYFLESMKYLEQPDDKIILANSASMVGVIYLRQDNYLEAIKNAIESSSVMKELGYSISEAYQYSTIGSMFLKLGGNHHRVIEYYTRALTIWQSLEYKPQVAWSYHDIGDVYMKLNDDSLALQNFSAALKICKETKDTIAIAENISSIGKFYLKKGNYQKALDQFYESLNLFLKRPKYKGGIPGCYFNIGNVFKSQGDSAFHTGNDKTAESKYRKALDHYSVSLRSYQELFNRASAHEVSVYIGDVQTKLKNYREARKFLVSALDSAKQFGERETIAQSYLFLSQLDSQLGNYKNAYHYYKQHMVYRDSIFNLENTKKIEAAKLQYEMDNKEQEIKLLASENKLKTSIAEKQSQQKKFAYALIGIVIILGGYAFYRYRRRKKAEIEQTKLKDRLNISQGLHDDIGSTLSSISIYSQVAKKLNEENEKEELGELLGKISETSNEMVSEMSDIVWAIHPRNDSMEKMIQRMESYARPLLTARNIMFSYQYDPFLLNQQLEMEKRKNFYLIFKEAVNNAIKYSGASELKVEIVQNNHHIELSIEDDGVGFNIAKEMNEPSPSLSGNGLNNMQARARDMHASLDINSSAGKGTRIKLVCPLS